MNSTSVRESIVTLRSVVRIVANRLSSSYCQSGRNANSVQRSCSSTFRSFRSSKCCWCLVEARRYLAVEIDRHPSTMPGGKNKKKGAKKQAHGQSQNMTPGTEKPGPDKNKSPDVETGLVASKSPSGEKRIEVTPAEESKESAAASEMPPTKADNEQESPVFGGASPMEHGLEKTDATEGDSEPKLTASEENVAKAGDVTSKVKVEVKEEKELSETLAQSSDKAVDHKVSQPSDDTDGDMMPDIGNKETDQIKDNNDSPKLDSPALMALAKCPEANKDSPNKIVPTQGSTQASDQGKSVFKVAETFSDRKRQEYHGTRQAAIMQERDKYLAMAPKDKRKFYGKRGYVTLDQIDTWPDYYADNEKSLKKVRPDANLIQTVFKGGFANYEADDELNAKVSILEGDITALEIDGIVNAANSSLLGGGGVDGSIHRAAGSQLLEECRLLSGCKTGDAKTTCGYRLPAKYVIHTVGPQSTNPGELRSCYARCLDEMVKYKMRTIAFCCISTGIYGYPNDLAVHVALATVRGFLSTLKQKNQLHSIDRVIFCLFLQVDLHQYQKWMQAYFPIPGANGADKRVSDKGIPDKTKDKVQSDSDCPAKDGKDEEKPKSLTSTETTSPSKEGMDEDKLKLSTSGQEPASMEMEELIASEEDMDADMDAEDGNTSSIQVGGTEKPDKRCKLDTDIMSKVDMV